MTVRVNGHGLDHWVVYMYGHKQGSIFDESPIQLKGLCGVQVTHLP
jgi:hypothetical protein